MTDRHYFRVQIERDLMVMASGRECFNFGVTPVIRPQVAALPSHERQAWWDGLLAGVVEAMVITMGEKATLESCYDLFTRARDAKSAVDALLTQARGKGASL